MNICVTFFKLTNLIYDATDLSHKRKTVSDLIRFIGNTTEYLESPERVNTPNYSILLGAGASVTSGIRSGQTLINEWKKKFMKKVIKKMIYH